MISYIRKLQSKPEEVRKQILVASLVFSMAIVGSIWVYSLTDRFGEKKIAVVVEEDSKEISPFKLFMNSVSDTYDSISASVGNFASGKEEVTESTPTTEEKQIKLIPVEKPTNQ